MLVTIAIVLAAIPAVAFPIIYALTAKWGRSLMGRSLMLLSTSIGVIMTLVAATTFLGPDYPGRQYVRIAVYFLLVIMLWFQLISYIVTVRRLRRDLREIDPRLRDNEPLGRYMPTKINLGRYAKGIVAVAGLAATVLADSVLDLPEIITLITAVLTAYGVYRVPNQPSE